ncbi:MAG TPA: Spy/CpxP family protein refolding chaperone, partial [Pyrinomonadaceae bacterium]|nr:Spy/CpxP family protein refolding chaperone [Pyrinomonadaceae bacterium]
MKSTRTRKILGGLALAAAVSLTTVAGFAQQTTPQTPEGGKHGGHRGGKMGRRGPGGFFGGRFAERLNLTDAQKEQIRQITERHHASTQALREQVRGTRGERGGFDGTFN